MKHSCFSAIFVVLLFASLARADLIQGDLLGVFGGNDSETTILTNLILDVNLLAKVDWPETSSAGLAVMNLTLNDDDEAISGEWSYSGTEQVDLFIVKAGNEYAVYHYTDANTNGQRNEGIWNTTALGNKGMSHVTAYSIKTDAIPEPAASSLLSLGCIFLLKRRTRIAAG